MRAYLPLIVTSLVTVGGIGVLVALGSSGWPGETGVAALEFCETLRPGAIKQPANTWSNLGFVVVGLAIAWQASRDLATRKSAEFTNVMVDGPFFLTTYASIGVLIGVGSAALHASTTRWGGQVDIYAMYLWVSWTLAYSAMRWRRSNNPRTFLMVFVPVAVVLAVRVWFPWGTTMISNAAVFGALVTVSVACEVLTRYHRTDIRADNNYLILAVAFFIAAFLAWIPSRTGAVLCYPDSLWQGHALWHILCAGSVGFVYLYGRSERAAERG